MSALLMKLGACCYIAWGLLHIWVSWSMWQLAIAQPPSLIAARLQQGALFMLFFAIGGIVAATGYTWRGKTVGYWTNLLLISYADIIWIILFIVPGFVGGIRGWAGPVLWGSAVILTSFGYFSKSKDLRQRSVSGLQTRY